ncbi:hypothetical protein BGX28_007979 [Mortierella sp. GBA30]|nr:hypothetical protein BGX28_007979 [Mortierella sp. GBA30]
MSPEVVMPEADEIRCMGPYQAAELIWLTPVWPTDAAEIYRVLNIDDSVANGLHSASMVYPFSEEGAKSFTVRQQAKRVQDGVCTSWAIRTSPDGPMIGLFALGPFDHGDLGLCYRTQEQAGCNNSDTTALTAGVEASTSRNTAYHSSETDLLNCGGIGYWISPEHAGKGIMRQVLTFALTKMARQEFNYHRVHGEAWVENIGSRQVMEYAGMRPAPSLPCFVSKFNATKDLAHYIFDVEP